MSKIVLDEKEVNELMDTFDFQKSMYLKKLEEITLTINKLDEIQKTQKEITDKLESYTSVISKFNFKNEQELTANYGSYIAFLTNKIEQLSKNSSLKRVEQIVQNSAKLTSFSIWKLVAIITICNAGIWFLSFYRA